MNLLSQIVRMDWKHFNLFNIIESCGEAFIQSLGNITERQQKIILYRLNTCLKCSAYSNGWCDNNKTTIHSETGQTIEGCGCNMRCKMANMHNECPALKWKSVFEDSF